MRGEARRSDRARDLRARAIRFEAKANRDALVELSGALKVVAVSMIKIGNDLALMGSGPRAGLAEIRLPELQKGSSIMPGKVNPVIPEVVIQVGDQVIGNDAAITLGGTQGQFELNVRVPLIARNLLDSIKLLAAASRLLDEKCVCGIEPNEEMLNRHAESTLQVATALNPHIGYDSAAEIVKEAAGSEPHRARGRAREGRRRGGSRRGARLPQDGPPARVSDALEESRTRVIAGLFDQLPRDLRAMLRDPEVVEELTEYMRPHLVEGFHILLRGDEASGFSERHEGMEGFTSGWRGWTEPYETYEYELHEVEQLGDSSLVDGRQLATLPGGGEPIESFVCALWVWDGELVERIEFHLDREFAHRLAREAAGN